MAPLQGTSSIVSDHGHGCTCETCLAKYQAGPHALDRILIARLSAAAVLFFASWICLAPLRTVSLLLALASIFTAGYDRLLRTVSDLIRKREIGEDVLMLVSAVAAFSIGRWLEGALGMLLVQGSALLTCHIKEKTRRELEEAGVKPDSERRSRWEEFIACFVRVYTPIVLMIAALMAVALPLVLQTTVKTGVYRALLLMVIACPCVFALTVPLSFRAGLGAAAAQGIRVRSTWTEDALCWTETIVFDQAPTLEGEDLRVLSVKSECMDADTFLRIAAHACAYSDGDYARGIKAAYPGTIYIEFLQSFSQEPGRGITVEVENVPIVLGTEEFVREHGVDPGDDATTERSAYLGINGRYAGRLLLGHVAREGAAASVAALSWDKERELLLFSADPPATAEKFARSVGVAQFYADCTPKRRTELLWNISEERRHGSTLLYAGDPSTDPDCFDLADVGAAASGKADLLADDPGPASIFCGIETARQVRRIVRQNVYGALGFKLVVLGLDLLGICPLWLAIFADAGVTLAAVCNTLRVLRVRAVRPGVPNSES